MTNIIAELGLRVDASREPCPIGTGCVAPDTCRRVHLCIEREPKAVAKPGLLPHNGGPHQPGKAP